MALACWLLLQAASAAGRLLTSPYPATKQWAAQHVPAMQMAKHVLAADGQKNTA